MKKLLSLKNWTIIGIMAALLFVTAFSAQPAAASSDFNLEVIHLINGNDLGLDRTARRCLYQRQPGDPRLPLRRKNRNLSGSWLVHHHRFPDRRHSLAQHDSWTRQSQLVWMSPSKPV